MNTSYYLAVFSKFPSNSNISRGESFVVNHKFNLVYMLCHVRPRLLIHPLSVMEMTSASVIFTPLLLLNHLLTGNPMVASIHPHPVQNDMDTAHLGLLVYCSDYHKLDGPEWVTETNFSHFQNSLQSQSRALNIIRYQVLKVVPSIKVFWPVSAPVLIFGTRSSRF